MRRDLRRAAAVVALALMLGGCSGPTVPLGLFVKEEKVDIVLGSDQKEQRVPAARPPGADPINPGFPSFVSPPPPPVRPTGPASAPGDQGPGDESKQDLPPPPAPLVACPRPRADQPPELVAGSNIEGPPKEGDYTYRRTGAARVRGTTTSLDAEIVRRINKVATITMAGRSVWRYDSTQRESNVVAGSSGHVDAVTTTTYELDQNATVEGSEQVAGIKIVSVNTSSGDGQDSFSPQPPVRIMTLPASAKSYDEQGSGTDPLSGTHLDTMFRTLERVEVEGCGVAYQAWRQQVSGVYYNASQTPGVAEGALYFASIVYIAPQYGGIVLRDELHLSDQAPPDMKTSDWALPEGKNIDVRSVSTINSAVPKGAS
ncbi:MAG: hypothetical protein QOI20_3088 [Acidimicrobiaceae bacterium]|nr:hypothetical protein [Acidimicrobiaceae bacterium]